MKYRLLLTIALVFGAIGCSVNDIEVEPSESVRVVFTAAPFEDGDKDVETRTYVVPNETYTSYEFKWSGKDTVGVYPDTGSQIYFTMINGEGVGEAAFDGGAWTCKEGHEFRSYYPFIGNFYLDKTKIPVSFTGQKQVENDNSYHFQKYDYMYTAATTKDSGFLNFYYNHLITAVLPWVELPAGHYVGLVLSLDEELFVTKGEYDLTAENPAIVGKEYSNTMSIDLDVTFTSPDILKVYVPLAPMDMSGKTLTITITDENGREFQYTYNPSKRYEASKIYRLRSATSFVDDIINFADPAVKAICVENWDANGDGELSYDEAAAVTDIGDYFIGTDITSFDEFKYFTGVTSIWGSFKNCTSLTSIDIPNSVISIEVATFKGCSSLSRINLPEGLTSMGSVVFSGCYSLKAISLPSTLTQLDHTSLTDNGIEKVECYLPLLDGYFADGKIYPSYLCRAFMNDYDNVDERANIKEIVIKKPSDTDTYGLPPYALARFSGAETISFPDGMISIGNNAFEFCKSLTSFEIQETVTTIGNSAFQTCTGLTRLVIPDTVISIGEYAFYLCSGLTSIHIPDSVTSIELNTFRECSGLTSIIIPDGVTYIKFGAFYGCSSLNDVIISDGVTTIGGSAFQNCTALSGIFVNPITPPIGGTNMFQSTNDCPIYVPAGTVDTYKSAEVWIEYADRIQCDPSQAIPIESVSLPSGLTLEKGSSATLTPTFIPDDATNKNVTWTSSDESVATVDTQGNVIAVAGGTATITVTTEDGGKTAACVVSVTVPVTGVSLNEYDIILKQGMSQTLIASVSPENATNKAVTWFSSNSSVASVGLNGDVTAISSGIAIITVNTNDGSYSATCNVTVLDQVAIPEAIDLGLPSGTKWASFNLGASQPYESGSLYAWGEILPKTDINASVYKWQEGGTSSTLGTLTKYCTTSASGYNYGFQDGKTILDLEDDAAYVNLGNHWRMPRKSEIEELRNNCTWTWTTMNGINGYKVSNKDDSGLYIFLPAAGGGPQISNDAGFYWTSTLKEDSMCHNAYDWAFSNTGDPIINDAYRFYCNSIRAVYKE